MVKSAILKVKTELSVRILAQVVWYYVDVIWVSLGKLVDWFFVC